MCDCTNILVLHVFVYIYVRFDCRMADGIMRNVKKLRRLWQEED